MSNRRPDRGLVRAFAAAAALFGLMAAVPAGSTTPACRGTLYLTIDTGGMQAAERIAAVLRRHAIKATFFVANEKTFRGDFSLDPSWTDYWRGLVADGHLFGSHTWRHWYFRDDLQDGTIRYASVEGQAERLDEVAVCAELRRPADAFKAMTGQDLAPIWRAPGGRTTPRTLEWAARCGYPQHVGWTRAGFLGDELPSDRYPNRLLLERALRDLRNGDVMVMHLGIWSRKEPFVEVFEPLVSGLKARGFCFATLAERAGR
jgi:peptidoglycan/xylan/chitin deacetylase (PgdA/CDA1 family)